MNFHLIFQSSIWAVAAALLLELSQAQHVQEAQACWCRMVVPPGSMVGKWLFHLLLTVKY